MLREAVKEAGTFGLAADQTKISEIVTSQDGFGDAQIEVVTMRQHEVKSPWRCGSHFGLRRFNTDLFDVCGQFIRRELIFAFVYPPDLAIDSGEQRHNCPSNVACAM